MKVTALIHSPAQYFLNLFVMAVVFVAPSTYACLSWQNHAQKAKMAIAIVEVKVIENGEGSKYLWPKLEILRVVKNDSNIEIGRTLQVGYLSGEGTKLPDGNFFAYLELYDEKRFKFLGGSLTQGISTDFDEGK